MLTDSFTIFSLEKSDSVYKLSTHQAYSIDLCAAFLSKAGFYIYFYSSSKEENDFSFSLLSSKDLKESADISERDW